MIEFAASLDQVSIVVWAAMCAGAGMYPLGIMLGADCSDCCPPFRRCLRFEAISPPDASRPTYGAMPMHGFSISILEEAEAGVTVGEDGESVVDGWSVPMPAYSSLAGEFIEFTELNSLMVGQYLEGNFEILGNTDISGQAWKVSIDPPTPFCGVRITNVLDRLIPMDVVSDRATFQPAPIEQEGSCTIPSPGDVRLLLVPLPVVGDFYYGAFASCVQLYNASAIPEEFFCGDALWAIERGTCRSSFDAIVGGHSNQEGSIKIEDPLKAPGSLYNDWMCSDDAMGTYPQGEGLTAAVDHTSDERCPASEATVTINEDVTYWNATQMVGVLAAGNYVLSGGGTCNDWSYDGAFPLGDLSEDFAEQEILASISVTRSRADFCDDWDEVVLLPDGEVVPTHLDGDDNVVSGWDGTASVEYGEYSTPFGYTIEQDETSFPKEGGAFEFTFCCPDVNGESPVGPNATRRQSARINLIQIQPPPVMFESTPPISVARTFVIVAADEEAVDD